MTDIAPVITLSPRDYDAVLFEMRIRYRGHSLDLRLTRDTLTVRGRDRGPGPIRLGFNDDVYEFAGGSTRAFAIR